MAAPMPSGGFGGGMGGMGGGGLGSVSSVTAQTGKDGVDVALQLKELRDQSQLAAKPVRQVGGRSCRQVNGTWVDEGLVASAKQVVVKAQSEAYFRILERHPEVKAVFQLGNSVVWVTPGGDALVIRADAGAEKMADDEIDRLFVTKK
jgi:Ca-activated chloride channel family protein